MEGKREDWHWTVMIMQPDIVAPEHVERAGEELRRKGKDSAAALRFESFHEGMSAQVLHVGTYASEGPVIRRLHAHIEERCGRLYGKHHEIYLSDPGRTAPSRLKTIVRQPFR
jgi:hypothetical protein